MHQCATIIVNSEKIKILKELLRLARSKRGIRMMRAEESYFFDYLVRRVEIEDSIEVCKWLLTQVPERLRTTPPKEWLKVVDWIRRILETNVNIDKSVYSLLLLMIPKLRTSEPIMWLFTSTKILDVLNTGTKENALCVMQCIDCVLSKMFKKKGFLKETDKKGFEALTKKLLELLYKEDPLPNGIECNDVFVLSALRVLSKLCTLNNKLALDYVSELIGLSNAYFLYGLNDKKIVPRKVLPSQQALALDTSEELAASIATKGAQARNNGGLLQKKRTPKTVQRQLNVTQQINIDQEELLLLLEQSLSDSELSGAEQPMATSHQRQLNAKMRLAALGLLGVVLHVQERQHIYGYWHVLFPTHSGDEARSDLLYVAQHDPNVRCRSTALQITARLIFEAKALLAQAEFDTTITTSFMPFSQHLGMLLVATYEALGKILAKEAVNAVLAQALRSLAMLVQVTPFKRIKSNVNLVSNFVQNVRLLVYHRDDNVQLAALMVMEFLLLAPELTKEITAAIGYNQYNANETVALQAQKDEEEEEEEEAEFEIEEDNNATTTLTIAYKNSSWLLVRILANAERDTSTPLLVQSYKVLNAMSTHFELLLPQLQRLTEIFVCVLNKEIDDKTIHVMHCLNSCTHHMQLWLSQQANTTCYEAVLTKCINFWMRLLSVIQKAIDCFHIKSYKEYCLLMDALSNMGHLVYEKLPRSTQMHLLSLLTNYGSINSTRFELMNAAAAVRTLAIYCTYPALRADFVFLENTLELALVSVKSSSVETRTKMYWALSSVSDALISQESQEQYLSEHLLRRYLQAAIEGTQEKNNDKIKCSAVHILGNLLSLLQGKQLAENQWREMLHAACKRICILSCTGMSKTRWNACYALSVMWRNKLLFGADLLPYQFEIYASLINVLTQHQNFKVRINASNALQQISERAHFGEHFVEIWTALLFALEQSHNLENFYEYNHRDKLQEQLCLSICQMLTLAELDDFPAMRQSLTERLEVVHNTWMRVTNRLVPETAAPLMAITTIILQKISTQTSNILKNAIEFVAQAFNMNSNIDLNNI